jgi:hypothetical protein
MFSIQEQEDRDYEINARYDYMREAYGDPCPRHPGVLRGGGDCGRCEAEMDHLQQLQDALDSVAGEPGQMEVSRHERKDMMQFLQARGWKVRCVGRVVIWEARRR